MREVLCWKGLHLFDIGQYGKDLDNIVGHIPQMSIQRYLDRFYLWIPGFDEDRRQSLLDSFFALIADEYESLIDVGRNLGNIQNLLRLVCELTGPTEGSVVIDYGCGTGLSLHAAPELKVSIVGVERCVLMRAHASARGMTVWSPGDLARQPKDSLPAAFASYVLHLLPHTDGVRLLWSRLKPGGVLVANFHKGQGIEQINTCLRENRCRILRLKPPVGSDLHGPYIAYAKEA